ncbi:MAG: hypothetical protein Q4D38_08870 [Planctomycetia bacterium]|nr:hypothetical protein [Planctomycetia bacterium]
MPESYKFFDGELERKQFSKNVSLKKLDGTYFVAARHSVVLKRRAIGNGKNKTTEAVAAAKGASMTGCKTQCP